VAGVYREQGFEAVSKWLFSVFRSYVEATHQTVREVHVGFVPCAAQMLIYSIGSDLINQRAVATSNSPARKLAES
jgi:hypothetical protein